MFCPNCGSKNKEDSFFCKECRYDLSKYRKEIPHGSSGTLGKWLVGIAAFILVVASVLAIFFIFDIDFSGLGGDFLRPDLSAIQLPDWVPFFDAANQQEVNQPDETDLEEEEGENMSAKEEETGTAQPALTEGPVDAGQDETESDATSTPTRQAEESDLRTTSGESGGKIVFTCQVDRKMNHDQLCLINPDGSGFRQLTDDLTNQHYYASLAPDGQSIVYSGTSKGRGFEIFEIDLNGSKKQLTSGMGELFAPEISPDGKKIVFTRHISASEQYISVINRDGSGLKNLTDYLDCKDPTWSPDGSRIMFISSEHGSPQVYIMNADGGNIRRITNHSGLRGRTSWSADGTIGSYFGEYKKQNREIVLFDEDGDPTVLTSGGDNLSPSFSPNGEWMVFMSYRDHFWDPDGCEIYIMRRDGSDIRRLTNNDYCDYQPRWGK